MISRFLLGLGLLTLMIVTSFGTFFYIGGRHSKISLAPQKPTAATPRAQAHSLPGTLYLAQNGALYRFSVGRFYQITPEDGWTQPSLFPDGKYLLAVKRNYLYSDVYVLSRFGAVHQQLTNNTATGRYADISDRHWSFYPRLNASESTIFMSYDAPKFGYDVTLSVWGMPVGAAIRQARLWSNSNDYTGGDVQALPLSGGGIIYTKYSYGIDSNLTGQLWFSTSPETLRLPGRALTGPDSDCSQPSLSPNGGVLAFICTYKKQESHLVIATWNGSSLGPLHDVISDQIVAQPTWAPDGSGIAYLAPGAAGQFQLWFLPKNAYDAPPPSPTPVPTPTPGGPYSGTLPSPTTAAPTAAPVIKPIQITTGNGFDATSPMTWSS
jgi:hypothetical protein